ncbi:MAG: hypothetical protein OJF60_001990 [Burkholderiaceae bacterium]|nr:MAG: hypothetical protein OJF60_001990 [Burkholderiaceae bacterium]
MRRTRTETFGFTLVAEKGRLKSHETTSRRRSHDGIGCTRPKMKACARVVTKTGFWLRNDGQAAARLH